MGKFNAGAWEMLPHAWSLETALQPGASTTPVSVATVVKNVILTGAPWASSLCLCSEPIFRQLCALHWLLEALTIDHTHHTMKPVITCWNPK